jgi:hypothetical protein
VIDLQFVDAGLPVNPEKQTKTAAPPAVFLLTL